jgi:hypothetical protein
MNHDRDDDTLFSFLPNNSNILRQARVPCFIDHIKLVSFFFFFFIIWGNCTLSKRKGKKVLQGRLPPPLQYLRPQQRQLGRLASVPSSRDAPASLASCS